MAQLGADVEQLDTLARRFEEECGAIESMIGRVAGQIGNTWWQGPDAERFKADWEGTFSAQLRQIGQALRDTGTAVQRQATSQREASNA